MATRTGLRLVCYSWSQQNLIQICSAVISKQTHGFIIYEMIKLMLLGHPAFNQPYCVTELLNIINFNYM